MPRPTTEQSDRKLLEELNKNISSWYSFYNINIDFYRRDRDFLFLQQWDASDKNEFKRLQKPMLTFNKIYDFYKKIVGEQRRNKPNLTVKCLTGDCSEEALQIRTDLIKKIAFDSRNDIVYQSAFESALSGGFGAFRVVTEYESAKSFNQHILVKRINNPERVFFDSTAIEPTKRDGNFCGYYNVMPKKEFEREYPDIRVPESFPSQSEIKEFNWGSRDTITVAEYYKKEWFTFTLYQLSNGQTVTEKELKKIKREYEERNRAADESLGDFSGLESLMEPEVVGQRKSRDYKIMHYKAISNQIIEKNKWPGKELPIIFVMGDNHIVEGEERTLSFVRFVKDSQRFLNYCGSEIAQAIKNNRREQFIGTPENVTGDAIERMWKNPSSQQGLLVANPDPVTKQLPIRLPAPELPQSLLQQYQRAELDIQSILGFFEANRGMQGQELSGKALRERKTAGNLSVEIFFDNLDRAIAQLGRVLMSMIPSIYDTERRISIMASDGKDKQVTINQSLPGNKTENDVTKGDYDVVLEVGPSFAVQQEQSMQIMLDLARINPEVFPLIADLIASNIDIEQGPKLVERLKNIVPPQVLAKEEGQPPPPPPPNPQAALAQQEMQIKQAELQLKQEQQQIEAAKTQIELEKLQEQRQIAEIKTGAELGKASLEYEADIASSMAKIMSSGHNLQKSRHNVVSDLIKSYNGE